MCAIYPCACRGRGFSSCAWGGLPGRHPVATVNSRLDNLTVKREGEARTVYQKNGAMDRVM